MSTVEQRCWFHINQHIRGKEYENIEKEAASVFLDFIKGRSYGRGISVYWFDLYVERQVNLGQQADGISSGCARLSAHIDKDVFDRASDAKKIKLSLSGSLLLLKYLAAKVPLPKEFRADLLAKHFEEYLKDQSLLLGKPEVETAIIKPFETTRFVFVRTTTIEVDDDRIHFNLNDIQDFINNGISGKTFGQSITGIDFGFELFDFQGQFASFQKPNAGLMRYGAKYKKFLVVKQFDYSKVKTLDRRRQYLLLESQILEGINDYEKLKRKPKDFDIGAFYEAIKSLLRSYAETNGLS